MLSGQVHIRGTQELAWSINPAIRAMHSKRLSPQKLRETEMAWSIDHWIRSTRCNLLSFRHGNSEPGKLPPYHAPPLLSPPPPPYPPPSIHGCM